jgi:hypothetical protein
MRGQEPAADDSRGRARQDSVFSFHVRSPFFSVEETSLDETALREAYAQRRIR